MRPQTKKCDAGTQSPGCLTSFVGLVLVQRLEEALSVEIEMENRV